MCLYYRDVAYFIEQKLSMLNPEILRKKNMIMDYVIYCYTGNTALHLKHINTHLVGF